MKKRRQTKLTREAEGRIREALKELVESDFSTPSDAEVALDTLASLLKRFFYEGRKGRFWDRTPSLYEVVEEMQEDYGLSEDAVEAAYEMKAVAEDAYRDEFDDDVFEEAQEWAEAFQSHLVKFLDNLGHG
jgi:hypothetical protein